MKTNLYKKKCHSCSITVNPGDGFIFKVNGVWVTSCNSSACLSLFSSDLENEKRKITIDGKIFMPYDRQAVLLVRSLPGAKWNPTEKSWQVSVKDQDLPRVIEVANKLFLNIPQELYDRLTAGTKYSNEAINRATILGLRNYQIKGVEFLSLHKRALLADDLGTGKTVQSLAALPENAKAIVISPASVKYNWRDEILKWRPGFNVTILSGRNSFQLPSDNEIVIMNYDILPSWLTYYIGNDGSSHLDDRAEEIRNQLKDVYLIVDEAHKTKNHKAARSKKIKTLTSLCDYVWFLTGTPLLNRPFDLYGVLSSGEMVKDVFGSFTKFIQLFNGIPNKWGGYEFGSPSPEVAERLKRIMLRRSKSEVLSELPPKTYQDILVDVAGDLLNELNKLSEDFDFEEEDDLPPFERFSAIRAELAKNRIPAMLEIIEEYEEADTPLVVFSAHRDPILEVGKRDGWKIILGGTDPEERRDIVKEFQDGKLKGIALTIGAGGEGLTLTRACHALFVDLDWTPAMNMQAADRLHRIGQNNSVLIKIMKSNHPLDIHITNLIRRKMNTIQAVMDAEEIKYTKQKSPEIKYETQEELMARIAAAADRATQEDNNRKKEKAKRNILSVLERERLKSSMEEPILTPNRKKMISSALDYMCNICDGAITKDGVGFNKPDASIAHWINIVGLDETTEDDVYRVTERILSRYYRQLNDNFKEIWEK